MFSKFTLFLSIIIILFVHFTILSNQKTQEKKLVSEVQPTITKFSVKKVVLKKKEIKKAEQKKEIKKLVKPKPIKKEMQKIVKNSKKKVPKEKIIKKEIEKQVKKVEKKIEKIVKKEIPKLIPTITKKIHRKVVPKKDIISTSTRNLIKNEYLSKLRKEIEKNKIYPKRAKRLKQQGKVVVSFILSKNGEIKNINLENASNFKRLNKAALELLEKIAKFEPIPKELEKNNWKIEIPINYSIINA